MTPYELSLYNIDYMERKKAEDEDKLILTYLGAYWQRTKKMPSLKQLLQKEHDRKEMKPEEILNQVLNINTKLNGSTY